MITYSTLSSIWVILYFIYSLAIIISLFLIYKILPHPLSQYYQIQKHAMGMTNSQYMLTRGGESKKFFDYDYFTNRDDLKKYSEWIVECISDIKESGVIISRLVFIEKDSGPIGLISMKDHLSLKTNIPSFIVRPKRYPFLPIPSFKGNLPDAQNENCLLISDVSTTGGHLATAIEMIRTEPIKGKVTHSIVLLNRGGEKCIRFFEEMNVKLVSNDMISKEFFT